MVAAALSAVVPGLGQALNGRRRLALALAVPVILVIAVAGVAVATTRPAMLVAWLVRPEVISTLLTLNLVLLAWRLVAVAQAFIDPRYDRRPGLLGIVGVVVLVVITVAPHAVARSWGEAAQAAFGRIFAASSGSTVPAPDLTKRINVLIVGIDKTATRTETLTDSMMVASLDPVGHTVSLVSVPRDMVNVPLGDGTDYGPKLNSLMSYADRHPSQFPGGGLATLESAIGALLGIHIDYYARMDFLGFMRMINAVGGVEIQVQEGFNDPQYDGFGLGSRGYSVTPGWHYFNGAQALAFARSREAIGQSDFKRAARQQQVLLALRERILHGGTIFWRVPELLAALGDLVTTDLPVGMLPSLSAVVDELGPHAITRLVISSPLVHAGRSQYGSVQIPDLRRIRAMAAQVFTAPGVKPNPSPVPSG